MSQAVGAKFGPYEIVGPLGAGGMEEMYRAKIGLRSVSARFKSGNRKHSY
jgi:hypothetical protein